MQKCKFTKSVKNLYSGVKKLYNESMVNYVFH